MTEGRVQRRLAAILAADVVGYGRLMEQDEAGTLAALKSLRTQILEPLVSNFHGRIFKLIGDGVLIDFGSAVDAAQCAIGLQAALRAANAGLPLDRRIELRIGINIGDVIVEGRDLYGDGVNVAARLEGMAEPGGICLSHAVYEQVRRKLNCDFDDLGLQSVKSLAEPVHVYRVSCPPAGHEQSPPTGEPPPLLAKLSIAILPFINLSGDHAQEPFVDGLTQDLITELSRQSGLFVIARHSSFAYKGKSIDARRIASELGVRYLVEGSARRSNDRVRVSVQLIDAVGGASLWADRFDRSLEDIFAVQDEVTDKTVEALLGRLAATPPPRNRPKSLEAYDLCVRARALIADSPGSPQAVREGLVLLQQAIAIDPDYAEANRWLAFNYWATWAVCSDAEEPSRRLSVEFADRAVALDPSDAGCRWVRGFVLAYERRWSDSDVEFAAALELDPSNADAWAIRADVATFAGDPAGALEYIQRGLRLNPHPAGWYYWVLGLAQYAGRLYEAAVVTLRKEPTYRTGSRRILAASLAQLGRVADARREAELFMASNPRFSISLWAAAQPVRDEAVLAHFVDGFRKAGLPD